MSFYVFYITKFKKKVSRNPIELFIPTKFKKVTRCRLLCKNISFFPAYSVLYYFEYCARSACLRKPNLYSPGFYVSHIGSKAQIQFSLFVCLFVAFFFFLLSLNDEIKLNINIGISPDIRRFGVARDISEKMSETLDRGACLLHQKFDAVEVR